MKLKTFLSLVGSGPGLMGARLMLLSVSFFRVYYLSAAFSSGLLAMLLDVTPSDQVTLHGGTPERVVVRSAELPAQMVESPVRVAFGGAQFT